MASCIFWATITKKRAKRSRWNPLNGKFSRKWALPTLTVAAKPPDAMADTHSLQPQEREPGRAFSSFLKRLSQALRGRHGDAIRESLEEVIEESERQNPELARRERIMLANLLKFGEMRRDAVKVPRADIVAVDESISICELIAK